MKIASIKKLVNLYDLEELKKAEESFYAEENPSIEIEGDDLGEKLTHVLAAIDIKRDVQNGAKLNEAIRSFSQRVRSSIS
tara:strand:+ start:385 stop:624 length:240 start_codon:yes stop_codon:yes gene_type:complete